MDGVWAIRDLGKEHNVGDFCAKAMVSDYAMAQAP